MNNHLAVPHYIQAAALAQSPLRHDWDESIEDAIRCADSKHQRKIWDLSFRSVTALSVASFEWVAWRLKEHVSGTLLFDVIEAVWAGIIDWRYLRWEDLPPQAWGETLPPPVGGPLSLGLELLGEVIAQAANGEPDTGEASALIELPLFVLSDPQPFRTWRRFVMRRLLELYPIQTENPLGPPVPREALNPDCNFKIEQARAMLTAFLQTLQHSDNPYLHPPDGLGSAGSHSGPVTR